jgi:hypothetical protein
MAEKNIILHWSRGYHEIFQNSIFLAYVPKKNILLAPWLNKILIERQEDFKQNNSSHITFIYM